MISAPGQLSRDLLVKRMVFLQYLSLPGVVRLTVCRYELLQEEERERETELNR